jgi:hypothetical protein
MIIARDKKENNIAEYLIYMFQVEDMLRASKLNIDIVEKSIINQFKVNETERTEIKEWYSGLIEMMKTENIEQFGHFQFIKNTLTEINEFHLLLLNSGKDEQYAKLYNIAFTHLNDLRHRMHRDDINDIETCINGLYSLFLLRLQKKEINKETLSSFSTFSNLLSHLAYQYKKMESGELEL